MFYSKSEDAQYHAWFHHNDADGFITVAQKLPDGTFKQMHYKPEEFATVLSQSTGENIFFSQNSFYKRSRRIDNIKQLRALYVDLDCYLLNYDPNWLLGHLETVYFNETIPRPNYIIFSGQGLNVIWLIEPVPFNVLPEWQAVQDYFVKALKSIGSDSKASDAARVFRIAGSINSKNNATVSVAYLHEERYALSEIKKQYVPEPKRSNRTRKTHSGGRFVLFNDYKLSHDRREDLLRLCELRNWDMPQMREITLFLYRYWSCIYCKDPDEALEATRDVNRQFMYPLSDREVVKATKSAETAYLSDEKEYNYSNKKLIEILKITEDEQKQLHTIIGADEKRIRNTEVKRQKRGSVSWQEYTQAQNQKREQSLSILRQAVSESPDSSVRELAEMMGVSKSYVQKLKQLL